jgi:hypothetical protein
MPLLINFFFSLTFPQTFRFQNVGITISKRRSCLKGDIVEALQCIKCAIRHDLLFQEPAPSSILEAEEATDSEEDEETGEDNEEFTWDELLIEDEDVEPMYSSESE